MFDAQVTAFEAMREAVGEYIWIAGESYRFDAEAVRGSTSPETETTDHPGFRATSQTTDFLLLSADVPSGYVPELGDRITDNNGDNYTLTAQGDNRVWRYSGSGKKVIRIHTKPEDER